MIKEIKIILGSVGVEYAVEKLYEKNISRFKAKKIAYMPLSFFVKNSLKEKPISTYKHRLSWIMEYFLGDKGKACHINLEELRQKLQPFEDCETLIFTLPRRAMKLKSEILFELLQDVFFEDNSSFDKKILVDFLYIDRPLEVEADEVWTQQSMGILLNSLNNSYKPLVRYNDNNILHAIDSPSIRKDLCHNIYNKLSPKGLIFNNVQSVIVERNSNINLCVLDFLGINIESCEREKADFGTWEVPTSSLVLAPEVIAFIRAFKIYANIAHDWLSQDAFISYKVDHEKPYTYVRPYWANRFYTEYNKKYVNEQRDARIINSEYAKTKQYVADVGLGVSKENALVLADLLSSEFRRGMISHMKQDTLEYQSASIRHVCAAVLKLENVIDDEKYQNLTKEPLGTILTGDENAQNQKVEKPKLTVLTSTYNHENFIEKQILSVIEQKTDFPVSHIIVDDCSTDDTREILKKYAEKYPHITLILRDKNNISFALYNIFDLVTTEYVALCEGDDYFTDPNKLQSQLDFIEENQDFGLSFHVTEFVYLDMDSREGETAKDGWRPKVHPSALPRPAKSYRITDLLQTNLIQTNSVMYRWRFPQSPPSWFIYNLCPGDWYWHLVHAEMGKIGFQPQTMSAYVRHPKGLFSETVYSLARHRRKYGIAEVYFFDAVNLHFDERYKKIMLNAQASVFLTMVEDAFRTNQFSFYLKLCKTFPELTTEFGIDVDQIEQMDAHTKSLENIKK